MSELTLTLLKFGFLGLLWVFVLIALSVMRSDVSGRLRRAPAVPARPAPRAPQPPRPARIRRGTPRTLVVTAGSLNGTVIRLAEAQVTLGRGPDCTLVLDDDYASTKHARVFPHDGQWYVEDLGSTNGTYLDRTKLTAPTPAPIGVPIRIGKTVLELRK